MLLELAEVASIRQFAADFAASGAPPLRAVVCNAGLQVVTGTTYTADGFETTFGVNHLGHFLLVNLLLRQLTAPARIVFVSSGTHDPAQRTGMPAPRYSGARTLAWPDTDTVGDKGGPGAVGRRRYTTSKLCNLLCTYELARRLRAADVPTQQTSITVNAFDPGLMPGSGLARDYGPLQRFVWSSIMPILTRFAPGVNTVEASGRALAGLVLDPSLAGVTGKYFAGAREIASSRESYDERKAAELWETSAELVGLTAEETIFQGRAPALQPEGVA